LELSHWEYTTWLDNIDYAIIGSGIVGLTCALSVRENHPNAKIVVFEKGILPSGASTKNAGFACFGSVSEILDDLKTHSEDEVIQLIRSRMTGLQVLRDHLGDKKIDFQLNGGYEIFMEKNHILFQECMDQFSYVNELTKEAISSKIDVFSLVNNHFNFKLTQKELILNKYEGQLNTGKMMFSLIKACTEKGIFILNNTKIESFSAKNGIICLKMDPFQEILTTKLLIATNGFARELLVEDIFPARAQVVVTKPIPNLKIKGTFHLDKGYYYFRNIDDRILLGGGRNLDFKGETTTELGVTVQIQQRLEELLKSTIIPDIPFEIDRRWSGIMGVGERKKPIVRKLSENVYCGIRLGGMGVAIGSLVGKELAEIANT
jgi:glycine/D-amino acid oxidase-like deaminating enzyme